MDQRSLDCVGMEVGSTAFTTVGARPLFYITTTGLRVAISPTILVISHRLKCWKTPVECQSTAGRISSSWTWFVYAHGAKIPSIHELWRVHMASSTTSTIHWLTWMWMISSISGSQCRRSRLSSLWIFLVTRRYSRDVLLDTISILVHLAWDVRSWVAKSTTELVTGASSCQGTPVLAVD